MATSFGPSCLYLHRSCTGERAMFALVKRMLYTCGATGGAKPQRSRPEEQKEGKWADVADGESRRRAKQRVAERSRAEQRVADFGTHAIVSSMNEMVSSIMVSADASISNASANA
jgi:hypothetical protein